MEKILITGGLGFIGSHIVAELSNNYSEVIIVDNLVNSEIKVFDILQSMSSLKLFFYKIDIRDRFKLEEVFVKHCPENIIHCASLKSVSESFDMPEHYYDNNVNGSKVLIDLIIKYDIKKVVFSSSATVYGQPLYLPIDEKHPLSATNPYGQNKIDTEELFGRLVDTKKDVSISILRYFNPVGAHSSLLIGESPKGTPNNLMPYILAVAIGKYNRLKVFGSDFVTPDGTGIRDYIHITDLASAHLSALSLNEYGCHIFNIGTGIGHSVLDLIKTFEGTNNVNIPYEIVSRREGDVDSVYSETKKAEKKLKWKSTKNLSSMCRDSYNFVNKK